MTTIIIGIAAAGIIAVIWYQFVVRVIFGPGADGLDAGPTDLGEE